MEDGLSLVVDHPHVRPGFPEGLEYFQMSICGSHVLGAALLDVHQVHRNVLPGQEQLGQA